MLKRGCKKVSFTAEAQRTQRKRGKIQEKTSANLRVAASRCPRVSAVGQEAFCSGFMEGTRIFDRSLLLPFRVDNPSTSR